MLRDSAASKTGRPLLQRDLIAPLRCKWMSAIKLSHFQPITIKPVVDPVLILLLDA